MLCSATPCGLLVIDELGPLEVEKGKGWSSAFGILAKAEFALGLVVVRPELVERVRLRLAGLPTSVRIVTLRNRDRMPNTVLGMIARGSG